jgi:carbon storage regulator
MLVLARCVDEEIIIDGGIIVTLVAVKGNRVRLGITAPPSVCVDRREVHERRAAFALEEEDLIAPSFTCEADLDCDTPLGKIA